MELDIQNENKSPRLTKLGDTIVDWVKSYPKDEFKDVNEGIELIVLGVDNKYKGRLCFMLGNNDDPIDSAFNATNHGIGDFKNKQNILESEIFSGITNYVAKICVNDPDIWDKFKTFVEKNIQEIERIKKNNELFDSQCDALANAVKRIVKNKKNKHVNK